MTKLQIYQKLKEIIPELRKDNDHNTGIVQSIIDIYLNYLDKEYCSKVPDLTFDDIHKENNEKKFKTGTDKIYEALDDYVDKLRREGDLAGVAEFKYLLIPKVKKYFYYKKTNE